MNAGNPVSINGHLNTITRDLMIKAAEDVRSAMMRTLSIAEIEAHLPIAMGAGGSCLGLAAAILWKMNGGGAPPKGPDPECMMLAALLLARFGLKSADPVGEAYKDLEALKDAGRGVLSGVILS